MPDPVQQCAAVRNEGSDCRFCKRMWTTAVLATMALALALRVIDLGTKSVFADEFASFQFARLDWTTFWHVITGSEANMALYYVLLRLWIHHSDNIAFVRFFSVVPAVITVPVVYSIGKKLFSPAAGLLASLLFSLNTFSIYYSQAARSYSWAVLLAALSCWLFISDSSLHPEARNGGLARSVAYIAVSTAALYTHLFAVFVIVAQFLSLIFLPTWRRVTPYWFWRMAVVGVLSIPLLVFSAIHKADPLFWVPPPSTIDVYHLLAYMLGSGLKLGLSIIALAVAGRELWRRLHPNDAFSLTKWSLIFLALWAALPPAIALVLSLWRPVFSPRFFLPSLPAILLLVSEGVLLIQTPRLRYALGAVLVCAWITALPAYYRSPGIEDWRRAASYLSDNVRPHDIIVIQPEFNPVLRLSLHQYRKPLASERIVPNLRPQDLASPPGQIWVVFCHPRHTAADLWPPVPPTYDLVHTVGFVGIDIRQYVRRSSAP